AWATISAATVRPSVAFASPPSPAKRTSLRVIVSPALPASFSTTILSPAATRYCLPPVRTIANMGLSNNKTMDARGKPRTGTRAATEGSGRCQPDRVIPAKHVLSACLAGSRRGRDLRTRSRGLSRQDPGLRRGDGLSGPSVPAFALQLVAAVVERL